MQFKKKKKKCDRNNKPQNPKKVLQKICLSKKKPQISTQETIKSCRGWCKHMAVKKSNT